MKLAMLLALKVVLLLASSAWADGRCKTCYPVKVHSYDVSVPGGFYRWDGYRWVFYATAPLNNVQITYNFAAAAGYTDPGATLYSSRLDLALILDQSRRLAESATTLAQTGIAGHQSLISSAITYDASKSEASADVLLLHEVRGLFQDLKTGRLQIVGGPLAQTAPESPIQQLATAKCISCHSGAQPKGGLDLTNIAALSVEKFEKATELVIDGKMPKDGGPLSDADKLLFSRGLNELLKGRKETP